MEDKNKNKVLYNTISVKVSINGKFVVIHKSLLNNEFQLYPDDGYGLTADELSELSKTIKRIKEYDNVLGG